MSDHLDNRIEFDAQTAAAGAVMDWLDTDEYRAFIGCTPAMVAQIAVNAYRRSREQSCEITTVEQLDALPNYVVVLDGEGSAWTKDDECTNPAEGVWFVTGFEVPKPADAVLEAGRALLIWHPDWAQS